MKASTESPGFRLTTGSLVRREIVAEGVCVLDFEMVAEAGQARPRPGQFFQIECGGGREHLLRRPLSVHDVTGWEGERAVVRFLVEIVGWGTRRLCSLEPGSTVGMLGPLGRGFERGGGKALLVAGGMGVAPLYFLAREMDREGGDYDFLAGFASGEKYYSGLGELAGGLEVYTEDGSVGNKGMVSRGATGFLEKGGYSIVATCGPEAMMAAVARLSEDSNLSCRVSLVSRMACGLGACRGCVREGKNGRNLCVCSEGPVFESRDVVWRTSA